MSDTGEGMPKDAVDKAFEPFFTTKPAGAGTGLGLSMVYGFVKQSRGHIKIYSEPGEGTTIKLYFPAAEVDAVPTPQAAGLAELPVAKNGEVILVVEDDPGVRKLVIGLLASLGYAVIEAEDGPMGNRCLDEADRVDLLLTDVVLPKGMSGPMLAREAQSRRPELKVLFMSGYTRNAVVHNGVLDEGTHLLMKPFRKADLASKIRLLLDEDGED